MRLAVLILLVSAACTSAAAPASGRISVVATTSLIADLATHVAGGRASVSSIAPPGASVEEYAPSPDDARRVSGAKVILVNGLALDRWAGSLVKSNASRDAKVVTLTDGLPRVGLGESDNEDISKNGNPHYWFDVKYTKTYVERIRDALIAADPSGKDGYTARTSAYLAELDTLDVEIRAKVAQVPQARRKLVTSHDAFPFFAKAYGFEIVGFAQPEPGKDPSPTELAELVGKVKAAKVPAIFSEAAVSPRLAETLAKEAGVQTVVSDLVTDSIGAAPADSYVGLMRFDVDRIVNALK